MIKIIDDGNIELFADKYIELALNQDLFFGGKNPLKNGINLLFEIGASKIKSKKKFDSLCLLILKRFSRLEKSHIYMNFGSHLDPNPIKEILPDTELFDFLKWISKNNLQRKTLTEILFEMGLQGKMPSNTLVKIPDSKLYDAISFIENNKPAEKLILIQLNGHAVFSIPLIAGESEQEITERALQNHFFTGIFKKSKYEQQEELPERQILPTSIIYNKAVYVPEKLLNFIQ